MAGISYLFTISRVAGMLGEDEEWLDEMYEVKAAVTVDRRKQTNR